MSTAESAEHGEGKEGFHSFLSAKALLSAFDMVFRDWDQNGLEATWSNFRKDGVLCALCGPSVEWARAGNDFLVGGWPMNALVRCWISLILIVVSAAAVLGQSPAKGDRIEVFVSIVPQAYFVERVGGDRVNVGVLVGPGRQPHEYEPSPKQLAQLASARALFTVGMPFEVALAEKIRLSFKNLTVVDTAKGISLRAMTAEESEPASHSKKHRHGKIHGHSHATGSPDPHIWLDPRLVKIQLATISETLVALDPAHADEYRRNLAAFQQDLDRLDAKLAAALSPLKGKEFYVYHPAFGYFADRYGLKQVAVEIGGKEPSARHLAQLVTRARKEGVKVIFVQPQFSTRSAETLAKEIHGAVIPLDDLAKDYFANMEEIATKVSAALGERAK